MGKPSEKGCRGATVTTARHLCRTQIDRFKTALRDDSPLTIGCTQEAALFDEELAGEAGRKAPDHLREYSRNSGLVGRHVERWAENGSPSGCGGCRLCRPLR